MCVCLRPAMVMKICGTALRISDGDFCSIISLLSLLSKFIIGHMVQHRSNYLFTSAADARKPCDITSRL